MEKKTRIGENVRNKNLGGKKKKKKKTKNKILVLAEIAIVLCSVFLVAPALAADQTLQKVSATEVTSASEIYEPGPLDVFGNANEDDTIDMRDTTYIKLVIFGKKPKTKLADANYDEKVSMLDVGQTKLIILGKEKKLTFIDIFGEAVTVNKPIKRLANLGFHGIHVTRMLGAMDILLPIGCADRSKQPIFFPEISKWPSVGYDPDECDFEKILSLKPDAVQTNMEAAWAIKPEWKSAFKEKLPGIPIISLHVRKMDVLVKSVRVYGYILDRKDEAEEFISWFEGYYNTLKSRTEGLSEDDKPRVYFETGTPYKSKSYKDRWGHAIILAGGKNIADEIPDVPVSPVVDPEWVIEQNPEIIFTSTWTGQLYGYETDDPLKMVALRQEILDRPELANVDAVKNKRVYVLDDRLISTPGTNIIGPAYMGKVFQPELFNDIDPQAMLQEYTDMYLHIDFDVREHGVFVYPPYEEWSV